MRRSRPRRLRPVSFHGWWKGLPFVALVFAVFFGEAWLRTGIQVNDYRMGETTRQIREVQQRIEALQAEESHLKRISRIDSAAPDLGLVTNIQTWVHKLEAMGGDFSDDHDTLPVSKVASVSGTLSGGVATIDLTALVGPYASAVTFSGLKLRFFQILNPAGNSALLTVAPGASDGYLLYGDASGQVSLGLGRSDLTYGADSMPTVGPTAKDIDLSSTDQDAAFEILLAAG